MNWLESMIYGLISGLTAFLPISTSAHQALLLKLFGESRPDPLLDLLVHLALIFSVLSAGRNMIDQLRRQYPRQHSYHSGRNIHNGSMELRFLKNSLFPLVIVFLVLSYSFQLQCDLLTIAIFLLINGIILFLQSRLIQGNKDERSISFLDSILAGFSGALSILPGISHIGVMLTVFTARGIDRQKAANWAILLSVPVLALAACKDILNMISGNGNIYFPGNIFGYVLAIIGAYFAGYFGVMLLKSLPAGKNYQGFAYYSWGTSLFSFILYLTIV